MQHNDTTQSDNEIRIPREHYDNPSCYQNNWMEFIGCNAIEDATGTGDVDLDFKPVNAGVAANTREVHFVAVPLN